jgi:hypothetical protein
MTSPPASRPARPPRPAAIPVPITAAGLAILLPCLPVGGAGDAGNSPYRAYRNPPAPRLAILPLQAPDLDGRVRERIAAALAREVRGLEGFRAVSPAPSAASHPADAAFPESLAVLRNRHRIDFALLPRVHAAGDSLVLEAALLDARTGATRALLREGCRCPAESLEARLEPAVRRLGDAPGVKGLRCDGDMALVPAASAEAVPGPGAPEGVFGPGAFCVDLYEYPNQPAGEPVVGKTWEEAGALCAARGKRLCTEAEWELACGGWEGSPYPYGSAFEPDRCNTGSRTIRLSGGFPGCRSPFGAYDLSGNVYEWTASAWSGKYADRVVRGGNWSSGADNATCRARFGASPIRGSGAVGFRCCLTLAP